MTAKGRVPDADRRTRGGVLARVGTRAAVSVGVGLLATVVLALVGAFSAGRSVVALQEDPFPHERHQGLFPLCTGCHEGVPTGDRADFYPEPGSCVGCHDGVERTVVSWAGARERVDNVVYDHVEHASDLAAAGDPPQDCAACHIPVGGGRMAVSDAVQLGSCWSCHAHATTDHFDVAASCERCHVPLAESRFGSARIEALPKPASHDAEAFLALGHGRLVQGRSDRCATCHTRDRCVACHVDADRIEIAALPPAPDGMVLPPSKASYPEPASHLDEGWLDAHAQQAPVRSCSTCHTTDDCRTCHVASVPDLVAALPRREEVRAPGVGLAARSPESHTSVFFVRAHGVLAAADPATCSTCHTQEYCVGCHDAEPGGGYHPANFVARHSADAFARDTECANCHEPRVFCRACHEEVGLTAAGRLGAGYHDASPLWLLQHGQAARQNLESCASCHKQRDCTQCHGVLGAFKVSPHTRDFDAARAWARSPRTCLACHIGNPLNGETP